MHWFVTDESNVDRNQGDFFIYGGLVLTSEQMTALHLAVREIRDRYGYQPGDSFKFASNTRPSQVSIDQARLAKQDALEAAERLGIRLIAYVVLHAIAGSDQKTKMQFAINTVMWTYHSLLVQEGATGAVSVDRVDESYGFDHLQHLFQHGLDFPSGVFRLDECVVHYGMSSNNASHISSVVDIAIGGFRYCVNTAGGKGSSTVAGEIFPILARLMWANEIGGRRYIGGYGYLERPRNVRVAGYADQYRELREALTRYASADAEESPQTAGAP